MKAQKPKSRFFVRPKPKAQILESSGYAQAYSLQTQYIVLHQTPTSFRSLL